MLNLEKKKLKIKEQLFADWDINYWIVAVLVFVFSIVAINKEPIFGYIRKANQLNYAEQKVFDLQVDSFQCGDMRETVNSVVLIPEMNIETGEVARYLLIINYSVTNTFDEAQEYTVKYLDMGLLNYEEYHVELAEDVELSEEFTSMERTWGFARENETTEECYYALWIYKDYDRASYYTSDALKDKDALVVGIGLQNYQGDKLVHLGMSMPETAFIFEVEE